MIVFTLKSMASSGGTSVFTTPNWNTFVPFAFTNFFVLAFVAQTINKDF